jgi:hypothetical protein
MRRHECKPFEAVHAYSHAISTCRAGAAARCSYLIKRGQLFLTGECLGHQVQGRQISKTTRIVRLLCAVAAVVVDAAAVQMFSCPAANAAAQISVQVGLCQYVQLHTI